MPRTKLIDGVRYNLTPEEETIRDQEEAQATIDKQAEIDAKINKENKKASGKQKLLDLGLTEAEVKALIGV
jgi:hypothetical protein